MNHTLTAPVATVTAERSTTKLRPGLLGGLGGLVFAGAVIAQNAIRSGFPMNDASTQDVSSNWGKFATVKAKITRS